MSLHKRIKVIHRDYNFIYSDGSVLNKKPPAAAIIDNPLPLNTFQTSLPYFLHA